LRRIGETLLSTLQNRVELLTVEIKEEKLWLVSALVFTGLTLVFAILSIVAVLVTIAFLTPEAARPWVLVGICLLCLGGLAFVVFGLKKRLARRPPLAATLGELRKDMECLKR
jgi:uncharacterized membrane protein YqjE